MEKVRFVTVWTPNMEPMSEGAFEFPLSLKSEVRMMTDADIEEMNKPNWTRQLGWGHL